MFALVKSDLVERLKSPMAVHVLEVGIDLADCLGQKVKNEIWNNVVVAASEKVGWQSWLQAINLLVTILARLNCI